MHNLQQIKTKFNEDYQALKKAMSTNVDPNVAQIYESFDFNINKIEAEFVKLSAGEAELLIKDVNVFIQ